jgi:hypothetical protein
MARDYKELVVNLIIVDHAATAAQLPSCHICTLHNYDMRDTTQYRWLLSYRFNSWQS